eukprot:4743106-Pleurochrysis_carterae.AAC.4
MPQENTPHCKEARKSERAECLPKFISEREGESPASLLTGSRGIDSAMERLKKEKSLASMRNVKIRTLATYR